MRFLSLSLLITLIVTGPALAKDDHHECEAAFDKLKAETEADFTSSCHHEHQQAKAANKALAHIKQK
ncbi:hypothetical protein QWI18_09875 [Pseudomonas sp. W2Oct36]|jgi:hypothetical protein|uniref:hypothetical protein n=1 Tax=unclassified Pseudomonas TaxID=196821 RepID=UPI000C139C0A|nr:MULTISPECIES: hypothetical protein [unclassified Pseudomonas]MBD8599935.1 hypothetical protein [Pseudomonas sp. CFBP 8772]PHX39751.1 hypothetical protein AO263_24015 [Pseudomonas sp. NZIPFR-PS5]RZI74120.1 MAG: hypothetical protein EOP13_09660 [Pseudomonas sp.]